MAITVSVFLCAPLVSNRRGPGYQGWNYSAIPPLARVGTTRIVASALRSLLISATTLVRFTFLHLSPSPHPLPTADLAGGGTPLATPL